MMNVESITATRFHPRVSANFTVKLHQHGKALAVKASDLSMAGVKLVGKFAGLTERLTLAIPLPKDRELLVRAKVKRHDGDELAVEFEQLDWDDMFALARFLHPRLP